MKTLAYVLIPLLLLVLASGCGSDKERGMNRPDQKKDLPRAAPPETNK
jgi:uncharacterized lipoprotein